MESKGQEDPGVLVELDELTIPALFKRSCALYQGLPAVTYVGEPPLTYSELGQRIDALAGRLLACGVGKGDKVALLGENSPHWVQAYLAVTSIGSVAVPILPGFPDSDVRHIIRASESVALFVSEKQYAKTDDEAMPRVRAVFSLEDLSADFLRPRSKNIIEKAKDIFHKKHETPGEQRDFSREQPKPDDLAVIIYTSGTTGHSKGVMLTHGNITSDAVNSIERFPISSSDRFLSILPLSHTFEATGGMLCPLAVGASVFYMKGLPAPRKLLQAMQTVKPTGVLTVPLVIDSLYRTGILQQIKARRLDRLYRIPLIRKLLNRWAGKKMIRALGGRLRFFLIGGAALNQDVETFLREAGIGYSTGYGMTEASPILTISPFGEVKPRSVGKPIPGVEIRIHRPDRVTGVGEIIVRGPNVMRGYYRDDDLTGKVFIEGGWLKTGDLGYIDEDGYLFIKGRSKNVIVDATGENIYPEIIEQQLIQSPYVQQAIVYRHDGNLVARLYLDYDLVDQELQRHRWSSAEAAAHTREILEQVRVETNRRLPVFSAIQEVIEQPEPFEMTPTKKIKRYLYTS
jgi:long-chain acyl-CoA synthetase